ncbi:MAG: cytochrome c maturation protein CcmE [Myxococcaceae bacterium]
MKPKTRNIVIAVAAILVAASGLGYIALGNLGENLVYYWSPSEMLAHGEKAYGPTIRLGGVVKPGTIEWNASHTALSFDIKDNHEEKSPSVKVSASLTPPQMFREGIGVVVEGTFDKSQVFKTNRLMVNHSNEYRPPKPGEDTKDWGEKTMSDSSGQTPEQTK